MVWRQQVVRRLTGISADGLDEMTLTPAVSGPIWFPSFNSRVAMPFVRSNDRCLARIRSATE